MDAVAAGAVVAGRVLPFPIPLLMTPSPRSRRANRQHFSRTPDLYRSRSGSRFTDGGLGWWLIVASVVAILFGIALVTH